MADNSLALFDDKTANIPDYVAAFMDETGANIEDRISVPSLSYEGKTWTISLEGEKTRLTKRDEEGDEVPVATMKVVILDYAKRRGRTYYEGAYDPKNVGAPVCWSEDGVAPHSTVREPQCSTCGACPMSAKGSKITEQGKETTACAQHRMVAVVPAAKMDMAPLRMKLAITSDFDKQSPEMEAQGWRAFSNYTDFLKQKGVNHTATLVTKMRFDPNTAYPKVMFTPDRWLKPEEIAAIAPVVKSETVTKLLSDAWSPNGVDGTPASGAANGAADGDAAERAKDMAAAKAIEDAAKAEEEEKRAEAARKAAATRKANKEKADREKAEAEAAAAAKPANASVDLSGEDDDDDAAAQLQGAGKSAKVADQAATKGGVPDDVAKLLADWDD